MIRRYPELMARIAVLAAIASAVACRNDTTVHITPEADAELLLTINVRDDAPVETAPAMTAVAVHVDARHAHEVLIVPGSGRTTYETLIGPLSESEHIVEVKPSAYWPAHRAVRVDGLSVRPVSRSDPQYDLLRRAPAIVLRPDTVGTSNDLPVLMYVEDRGPDARTLRYTTIFTNEDGGTDTPALFARWGRACDIEQTYEVRLDSGDRAIEETFQGPEHKIMPFNGPRIGDHPVLSVATRNNMFLGDRAAGVSIRPVPVVVKPDAGTRESILDERPWLQRLTARELAAEKKPFDPRDFVYLEAQLRLDDAAAAAWIEQPDGRRITSDRGDERLTVTRDGWVRIAVPVGRDVPVAAAGWSCLPRKGRQGPCRVEPGRVFRLSDDFRVEPLQVRIQGSAPGPRADSR
jgi:hypothetical protein